jgi:hypothetical protein
MRISLRRLPNGEIAVQRITLRSDERRDDSRPLCQVRLVKAPIQPRSFIDALLGEKGRAIVARINPRFRLARLKVVQVQRDER